MAHKLGFIGSGIMATSIMGGLINSGLYTPDRIIGSDRSGNSLPKLIKLGIQHTNDNVKVIDCSDIIIISVKPYAIVPMLTDLVNRYGHDKLSTKSFISICAGTPLEVIEQCIPTAKSVIRVMPNTPCLVGQCAAAYAIGSKTTNEDKLICEYIFKAIGTISEVQEKLMDAVTGLSGSGPAYIFILIEALADGGVRGGLPRNIAMQLAIQTVKGAATMVQETGLHPAVLKDQVCSPGGTTIAAVEALEKNGFRAAAISAVVAATNRGKEMREGK